MTFAKILLYSWFVVLILLPLSMIFPPLLILIPVLPVIWKARRASTATARAEALQLERRTAWVDGLR